MLAWPTFPQSLESNQIKTDFLPIIRLTLKPLTLYLSQTQVLILFH